jgi:hypothetical protein
MNERIQQLADQATTIVNTTNSQGYSSSYANFDREKFAELIVQECAALFPLTFTDEQYQRRIDKTIRKHFGVEE